MITSDTVTFVQKVCAYVTRDDGELLVFEGPEHEAKQVPKGTVEDGETPRNALRREVREETGLSTLGSVEHLTTDLWQRREGRWYIRHFFHATVDDAPEQWVHTVTGEGEEVGDDYACAWLRRPRQARFALDLDEYLHLLRPDPPTATPPRQSSRS